VVNPQKASGRIVIMSTLIRQEWITISEDFTQKLLSSMLECIEDVIKKDQQCKY